MNITSLQSHILQEEARHKNATGDFTWILSAISLAAKAIAAQVRRARIEDVLGDHGGSNVHGETQQKLDVIANHILMTCLGSRPTVAVVASEEDVQRLKTELPNLVVEWTQPDEATIETLLAVASSAARSSRRGIGGPPC